MGFLYFSGALGGVVKTQLYIMSWSAYLIGTPAKITEALQKQSEGLSGNSKTEFDNALPHIIALMEQNKGKDSPPVIHLQASGSAYEGESSCIVNISSLIGALV